MEPLRVDEVRPPDLYEPVRSQARRQLIELKRDRRIAVGDLLSVVFENRETVRGIVEELLRAERIQAPDRIAEELDVFNTLIPAERELSGTLFIELTDPAELLSRLAALRGIEAAVHLEVGGDRVERVFEEGRSRDDRTSSVHYLRFRLTGPQRAAFLSGGFDVAIVAEHESYRARAVLTERQRAALGADLLSR